MEDLTYPQFIQELNGGSSTVVNLENDIKRILQLESPNQIQFGTSILKDKIELLIACVDEIMNDPVEHNEAQMWKEMVATASTAVMYEICRVQKLTPIELRLFDEPFISHLFSLVERTRDARDETFNYSLIRLIIALNEQFMVSAIPPPKPSRHNSRDDYGGLPAPIMPTYVGQAKKEQHRNLVLEVLKETAEQSKTFGENIIFILNRANGSADSLCVSLLILKILYLLFTTVDTQEYFYTNDLCVLVDVFIRELCDLGHESEGLKHTYLRVLHPLLTNTQLRQYPHKRPQLRRVLVALISSSNYRDVDPTTRRLVDRNLTGSWCDGMLDGEIGEGERRTRSHGDRAGGGWSSGMGRRKGNAGTGESIAYDDGGILDRVSSTTKSPHNPTFNQSFSRLGITENGNDSSVSVNEIARAHDIGSKKRHHSLNVVTACDDNQSPFSPSSHEISVIISPPAAYSPAPTSTRRRRPPPPPPSPTSSSSRPSTPLESAPADLGIPLLPPASPGPGRRAAPLPPRLRKAMSHDGRLN